MVWWPKNCTFPLRYFMGQPNHLSGMARVFKDYTDLPATHEWNEAYLPAEAGPTPEGWKAEARPWREYTLPGTEITLICRSGRHVSPGN